MTELYRILEGDGIGALQECIKKLDTKDILMGIEDTVQLDVAKLSHDEWVTDKGVKVFKMLLRELVERVKE